MISTKKRAEKVKVTIRAADVLVEIRGIPHLILRRADLCSVESWIKTLGTVEKFYFIEFVTKTGSFTCDYDDRELWEEILTKLAASNLFAEMQGEATR